MRTNLNVFSNETLRGMVQDLSARNEELEYLYMELEEDYYALEDYTIGLEYKINKYRQEARLSRVPEAREFKNKNTIEKRTATDTPKIQGSRGLTSRSLHTRTITPVEIKKLIKIVNRKNKNKKIEKPSKHTVSSTAGNVKGTKHSGHKTKNELLQGKFPDGTIKTFKSVNDAKKYTRKNIKELKDSALTNISAAARRSGFYTDKNGYAYGIYWNYISKGDVK